MGKFYLILLLLGILGKNEGINGKQIGDSLVEYCLNQMRGFSESYLECAKDEVTMENIRKNCGTINDALESLGILDGCTQKTFMVHIDPAKQTRVKNQLKTWNTAFAEHIGIPKDIAAQLF